MRKNYFRQIRLFPLNKIDFPSYESVKIYIENGFHNEGEVYPGCIDVSLDNFVNRTLTLFQYEGAIIGAGILRYRIVKAPYTTVRFFFDIDTVKVFQKAITSSELKNIVKEFKRFNSVTQIIDYKYAEQIINLITKRPYIKLQKMDECSSVVFNKKEGGKVEYYTTKYERVNKYREEAIRIHGLVCEICGFDFEKTYGAIGRGYIEVHHKVPLYSLEQEIIPNPEKDMICVCANCHRMIHRDKYSIVEPEKLKEVLRTRNNYV